MPIFFKTEGFKGRAASYPLEYATALNWGCVQQAALGIPSPPQHMTDNHSSLSTRNALQLGFMLSNVSSGCVIDSVKLHHFRISTERLRMGA
jgi:hypothetical protein